jgi:hypothetical protein
MCKIVTYVDIKNQIIISKKMKKQQHKDLFSAKAYLIMSIISKYFAFELYRYIILHKKSTNLESYYKQLYHYYCIEYKIGSHKQIGESTGNSRSLAYVSWRKIIELQENNRHVKEDCLQLDYLLTHWKLLTE